MCCYPLDSRGSCSASRQERRLKDEIPACRQSARRRRQGAFRKTACLGKRAYLAQNTPLPVKSRTTTEGPFGELIRSTGPMAKANPFRFSTKYQDDETDLLYYGYRYYNASTGRWSGRDSLEEDASLNLYGFVRNAPTISIDEDGRQDNLTVTFKSGKGTSCGGWDNWWLWQGSVEQPVWIVQHITVHVILLNCALTETTSHHDEWWEAFRGPRYGFFSTEDHDRIPGNPNSISGATKSVTGEIELVPDKLHGKDIKRWGHQAPAAGDGYSTYSKPTWWGTGNVVATRKTWVDTWNCCCPPIDNGTMKHSP